MEGELASLVGMPGSPIRRTKGGEVRNDIQRRLATGMLDPKTLLRAYLSIGRTPPRELLTKQNIVSSLNAHDCATFLPLLVPKVRVLEPNVPLDSLSELLSKHVTGDPQGISTSLARVIKKWDALDRSMELSQEACPSFLFIVTFLLTQHPVIAMRSAKKKSAKVKALVSLVKFGTVWATKATNQRATLLALKMILAANKLRSIDLADLLAEDEEFSQSFEILCGKASEELTTLADDGLVSEFKESAEILLDLASKKTETHAKLERLFEQRGRFHETVQRAIAEVLGLPQETQSGPEISLPLADKVETTQLASALLRAWAAKDEGAKANDAFKELQSILRSFFGIELKGNAGDLQVYNPRLHEFAPGVRPTSEVKLLHPWVECSSGTTVRVVIKALVRGES